MISAEQIKMARSALGWSIEVLASHCAVSSRTVKRIESQTGIPVATAANLKLIRVTLEAAGIEFIGAPEDGPGIRLWSSVRQF